MSEGPSTSDEESLMKLRDIAEWLNVTDQTVHKLMRDDDDPLPFFRLGREYRFDRIAVKDWLQRRTNRS